MPLYEYDHWLLLVPYLAGAFRGGGLIERREDEFDAVTGLTGWGRLRG